VGVEWRSGRQAGREREEEQRSKNDCKKAKKGAQRRALLGIEPSSAATKGYQSNPLS
jgi:hypothetical protein